jgi:chemotaxis protein CheD
MEQTSVKIMQCKLVKKGQLVVDCIGVGVGVIFYDRVKKIGVGLHVLAPRCAMPSPPIPAKFADSGIPHAMEILMQENPSAAPVIAIAGGSSMEGSPAGLSMGGKVVAAIKEALDKANLKISIEETGGTKIRSLTLDVENGQINIK